MKKLMKVLSLFLICVVTIMSLPSVSFAATIGDKLQAAEEGWQRFKFNKTHFVYTGRSQNLGVENDRMITSDKDATVSFKFKGTKIRIVGNTGGSVTDKISITIDGETETFSVNGSNTTHILLYEKTGLDNKVHTITIGNKTEKVFPNAYLILNGIDIDDTGSLLIPDEEDPKEPEVPEEPTNTLKVVAEIGENIQLSVNDNLSNNTKMTWSSDDSAIASVDSQGVVTGVAPGNAVITVTNADGTYKETINILVIENEPQLAVDLNVGDTRRLTTDDLTDTANVTWASDDTNVAIVDSKGRVTAVALGTTFVTVKDDQGNDIGKIYVRVRN